MEVDPLPLRPCALGVETAGLGCGGVEPGGGFGMLMVSPGSEGLGFKAENDEDEDEDVPNILFCSFFADMAYWEGKV